jgi:molybdate transport system regulatory protein
VVRTVNYPVGLTHLRVTIAGQFYLGPGRVALLQNIADTGSISSAGKALGMSYKRAWTLVQALNEGAGTPLVESSRGGAGQGGASLTAFGHEVLERYRAMEAATQGAIARDVEALRGLMGAGAGK